MFGLSFQHLLLLALVVLIFFGGKGKISDIMGDVAKGVKSFKKGLADDDAPAPVAAPTSLDTRVGAADVREPHNVN